MLQNLYVFLAFLHIGGKVLPRLHQGFFMVIYENSPLDLCDPRGHWVMLTPKRGHIRNVWEPTSSKTPSFALDHHDHQVVGTFDVKIRVMTRNNFSLFVKNEKTTPGIIAGTRFFPHRCSAGGALRCSSSGTMR